MTIVWLTGGEADVLSVDLGFGLIWYASVYILFLTVDQLIKKVLFTCDGLEVQK